MCFGSYSFSGSHSSSGNLFPIFPLPITELPFSILEKHFLTTWVISSLSNSPSYWYRKRTFHVSFSFALSHFSVHPTSATFLPEDNANLLFVISVGQFSVFTIFDLSAVDNSFLFLHSLNSCLGFLVSFCLNCVASMPLTFSCPFMLIILQDSILHTGWCDS